MINIKKITFITFLCFIFNISNFAYSIQIDESDRNLDKIRTNISENIYLKIIIYITLIYSVIKISKKL